MKWESQTSSFQNFPTEKETREMYGISHTLSVEMKLVCERRLFINMVLASSVKTGFDRKRSAVFLPKGK